MKKIYPLLTVGNAIVDILATASDEFLQNENIVKGAMNLIEKNRSEYLYEKIKQGEKICGGSAANTAVAFSSLASNENMAACYFGKVSDDELGKTFINNIRQANVGFNVVPFNNSLPTARSIIFITPDSERSMNTYLGSAFHLSQKDICYESVRQSKIIYFEGYVFDSAKTKNMFYEIVKIVKKNNNKIAPRIAISLADSLCVERHKNVFLSLIEKKIIDIIFCNETELLALFEMEFNSALEKMRGSVPLAVITRGEKGSMAIKGNETAKIKAKPIKKIINTTGAGDCYAGGFLFALIKQYSLKKSIEIGSLAAACSLQANGAVPQKLLKSLIE